MHRREWLHRMGIMAGAAAIPGCAVRLTVAQTTIKDPEHPRPAAISLPDYEP